MILRLGKDVKFLLRWTEECIRSHDPGPFHQWVIWNHPIDDSVMNQIWYDEQPIYKVNLNIIKKDTFDVKASAGFDEEGFVTINVNIFANSMNHVPSGLRSDLINVYAHELQHLTQYNMPFQRVGAIKYDSKDVESNSGYYEYFTDENESEAFAAGCLYESRSTGMDFATVSDSFLSLYVFEKAITKKQKQIIKEKWKNSINKVF